MFDSEALLRKGAVAGRGPIPKRSPQVDGLPDIIRSRVGPQFVRTMAEALDAILLADVHSHKRFTDDGESIACMDGCPWGIAYEATKRMAQLQNLAVVGG